MDTGVSEVQTHPWPYIEYESSLGKKRPHYKRRKTEGRGTDGQLLCFLPFPAISEPTPAPALTAGHGCLRGLRAWSLPLRNCELNEHYRERRCRREGDRSGPLTAADLLQ